ncbi:hypothetical protein HDU81_007513 [Chytriomyces hyalinus]|nr:hypothetical protein HDU81_007513 [Chytriomyces hyalinus]
MVLIHTVAFTQLATATDAQIEAAASALRALEQSIDSVEKVYFGRTFTTQRAKGYTHQLVVHLRGKDDLEVYAKHPEHVSVIQSHMVHAFDTANAMAMDFEC